MRTRRRLTVLLDVQMGEKIDFEVLDLQVLHAFCGDHLLCARLRPSDIDASAGNLEEEQWIVQQIRS